MSINALVLNDFLKYGVHMLDILDELNLLKLKKFQELNQILIKLFFVKTKLL